MHVVFDQTTMTNVGQKKRPTPAVSTVGTCPFCGRESTRGVGAYGSGEGRKDKG